MIDTTQADVVIIGGGIVGTAIARELSRYQLTIVLLERHPDVAMGTSKANSGILHSGFDAPPDSLKARLNVRGNELYRQLQQELDMEIKWLGSLVVAKNAEELETLEDLLARGRKNGVPGLEMLTKKEVLAREPNLSSEIAGALWAPTAGVICPFTANVAFAENAVRNGVKLYTECEVKQIVAHNGKAAGVETNQGFIQANFVVNAAGVYADEVSRSAGDASFTIKPRKGEYILFDKTAGGIVNSVIFPAPSKVSKGILVAPTVHGNVFIGPNAVDTENRADLTSSQEGLNAIITGARRLVPAIPLQEAIVQFAGLRAAADTGDFVIRPSTEVQGLIHAAGIQSPGLTAAPAIAEMVAGLLHDQGLECKTKENFIAANPPKVRFRELSHGERMKLIQRNPLYGRVICRCETVTEGEIVDAIHAPCGARTVDGVKRRTRAGTGRCQGGFCGPRVTAILARELNIPITQVRKDTGESYLFYEKIPVNCEVALHE